MTTGDPHERAAQLSTTGVPQPFKVYGYVKVNNPKAAEKRVHQKLHKYRVSNNREFFKVKPEIAIKELDAINEEVAAKRREREERKELIERQRVQEEKRQAKLEEERIQKELKWEEEFEKKQRRQELGDEYKSIEQQLRSEGICGVLDRNRPGKTIFTI
jgi:hypothetical protein